MIDRRSLVILLALICGCDVRQPPSVTQGTVRIEVDESIMPVMEKEVSDFLTTYTEATINVRYLEARESVVDFIHDSVRVIVLGRPLNREEQDALKSIEVDIQTYKFAYDAMVVIVHKDNPVTELRMTQLDSIFSGALKRWPGRTGREIEPVIGNLNSSVSEVFRDSVLNGKPYASHVLRVRTSQELVEYVGAVRNAIGIVALSWMKGNEQLVSVVKVARSGGDVDTSTGRHKAYQPHQAYIHTGKYPLVRSLYIYDREVIKNVGLGFISYVTSAQGQKVILRNGLVPATMPVRLVEVTSKQVQ